MAEPSLARVKEVFLRVVDSPAPERAGVLDEACAGDESLRSKVVRMLAAEGSGFMASPVAPPIEVMTLPDIDEPAVPERVGAYRVLDLLGEGGFGSVYRAEQTEPIRREVAVKVIKPGMDSRQVIARFQGERQALASLDHPNIASVFDAGATEDGRPYFAMELIRGVPITRFCDEQGLTVAERLSLFLDVCRAVRHAHQKGLIHRDLKPSNVLVQHAGAGDRAVVKVIDFGIAKAVDDGGAGGTLFTEAGQLMGTPDYMSPEQADPSIGSADTRSDIYALGAMLYELLAGSTPLGLSGSKRAGLTAIVRRICVEEPERPSARLASSADAETLAAARGDDAKRLAALLRGDLDWIIMRALEKEPHRRYETVDGLASDIERHLADEPVLAGPPSAAYRAKKFVRRHRLGVGVAAAAVLMLGGTLAAISVTLSRALEAERDAQVARGDTDAFNEFLLDDLIGAASPERDGHTVTVVSAIEKALGTLDERFADRPTAGARIRTTIGGVYHGLGLLEDALAAYEQSAAEHERLLGADAAETLHARTEIGSVLHHMGRSEESEAVLREVVARLETKLDADDPLRLRGEAILGERLQSSGKFEDAEPLLRGSIDGMRRVLGDDDPSLLGALASLGALLSAQRRLDEAEPVYLEALRITLERYPESHPARLAALNNTAVLLLDLDKPGDARPILEQLVAAAEVALPEGHWQIAWARYSYAACLLELDEHAEALPVLRQAYAEADAALGEDHFLTERTLGELVSTLDTLGDPEALAFNRVSVVTRLRIANAEERPSVRAALREFLGRHGKYAGADGSWAFGFAEEAGREMLASAHPNAIGYAANLGWGLADVGEADRAGAWLTDCYDGLDGGGDHAGAARLADELATLFASRSMDAEATRWRERAEAHRAAIGSDAG